MSRELKAELTKVVSGDVGSSSALSISRGLSRLVLEFLYQGSYPRVVTALVQNSKTAIQPTRNEFSNILVGGYPPSLLTWYCRAAQTGRSTQ
jgi:hypothetical protein